MAHHLACPRIAVPKVAAILPIKYIEALEHNQKIASCCRHPENHEIEAWYSSEADRDKGVPDIYIFHCTCGRRHVRFCVGGSQGSGGDTVKEEKRPFWTVR
jgi:hypothetical protein